MKKLLHRLRNGRQSLKVLELFLVLRALLFLGSKYTCPCCGWKMRAFATSGTSFRQRALSYCPRCNAKARHRRIWLFMEEQTNLFSERLRLLEIAPKFSLARRFTKIPTIDYVAGDLHKHPNRNIRLDVRSLPFLTESCDALLCVHVLEEVAEDRQAMDEMYRVLKPGGWALVSVPTNMDAKTYEDPSIVLPDERERAFGEPDHVRVYGYDLADRLRCSGFEVSLNMASDVPNKKQRQYGLRNNENLFYCRKY